MSGKPVTDPRILSGMRRQLAARAAKIEAGDGRLGWKAGFGAPAALVNFGLDGPLMGYMLQSSLIASGASVALRRWVKPVAEPEIAIYLGADLGAGTEADGASRAIAALGPAIELADLEFPPEDVEAILAGNIYHRHVILGARDERCAGANLSGLTARITRGGAKSAVTDLEANTGRLLDIVAHLANTLAVCDERLHAGDVIIAGSLTPPMMLTGEDTLVALELDTIGAVSVAMTHD